jgi:hypothetical protein
MLSQLNRLQATLAEIEAKVRMRVDVNGQAA